jgi:hypothetical protein
MKFNIYSLHKLSALPEEVRKTLYDLCLIEGNEEDFELCYQALIVEHQGKIVFCQTDNMEPEDASFVRDLSWVSDALQKVYELGKEDGYNACDYENSIPTFHA